MPYDENQTKTERLLAVASSNYFKKAVAQLLMFI